MPRDQELKLPDLVRVSKHTRQQMYFLKSDRPYKPHGSTAVSQLESQQKLTRAIPIRLYSIIASLCQKMPNPFLSCPAFKWSDQIKEYFCLFHIIKYLHIWKALLIIFISKPSSDCGISLCLHMYTKQNLKEQIMELQPYTHSHYANLQTLNQEG